MIRNKLLTGILVTLWAGIGFAQSPDTLFITNTVGAPGDTVEISIFLKNTQFSVAGFKTQFVLRDSSNASLQRMDRGDDVLDFDFFNPTMTDGFCRLVGIGDLSGHGAPPLTPGLHELARVYIFIEPDAPLHYTDSLFFWDDSIPPDRDNSISDSSGYINEVPTLINGSVMFNFQSGIEDKGEILPRAINLFQNYPNPFNGETKIEFDFSSAADQVSLQIYDLTGRLVREYNWVFLPSGRHSVIWDGRNESAKAMASGIYFYRLSGSDVPQTTRRMTLLK